MQESERSVRNHASWFRNSTELWLTQLIKDFYKRKRGEYNSTKTNAVFYQREKIGKAIHDHYAIHYPKSLATITLLMALESNAKGFVITTAFNSIQKVMPSQL